jgi:hypothetical protein
MRFGTVPGTSEDDGMTDIDDSKAVNPRSAMPAGQNVPGTPVLITEHRVLFASAAARGLVPTKGVRRWLANAGALRRKYVTSKSDARPQRYHPERYAFLDSSCMARQMHRL